MPQKFKDSQRYTGVKQDDLDATEDETHSYDEESLEAGRYTVEEAPPARIRRPRFIYNIDRRIPKASSNCCICCRGFCYGILLSTFVFAFMIYRAVDSGIATVTIDYDQVQQVVNNTVQSIGQTISNAIPSKNGEPSESIMSLDFSDFINGGNTSVEEPNAEAQADEGSDASSEDGNEEASSEAQSDGGMGTGSAEVIEEPNVNAEGDGGPDADPANGIEEPNPEANADGQGAETDAEGNAEPNADGQENGIPPAAEVEEGNEEPNANPADEGGSDLDTPEVNEEPDALAKVDEANEEESDGDAQGDAGNEDNTNADAQSEAGGEGSSAAQVDQVPSATGDAKEATTSKKAAGDKKVASKRGGH